MKLDSIIYDTSTLSSALTQKLREESPTFNAMYPSDTGTALVNLLAGYGSMMQYSLVSAMANCYTDTAFSVDGIYQLAETLGNRLHGNVSSQITCSIRRNNCIGTSGINIPANSIFDVDGVKFFNESNIVFPLYMDTISNVLLIQGEHKTAIKTTSGVEGEKIYFSENFKCDMSRVKVYVNDELWGTSETFLNINSNNLADISEAKVVVLRMDPDGRAYIKFGNNTNGVLPPSGSQIKIQYVSNEGSLGNIANSNANITLETPLYFKHDNTGTMLLDVTCTTTSTASGGYNTQDLQTLKESSPFVFASGDRAVRRNDYKAILLNKCGYLSCNVWGEYEESLYYGYYALPMMNTVYYTGVKSLRLYNNKSVGAVVVENQNSTLTSHVDEPVNFVGYMGSLKGFAGSYSVDIVYSLDTSIRMNYSDKFGNGILMYDASSNLKNEEEDENGAKYLYPYDDLAEDYKITGEFLTKNPSGNAIVTITSPQKTEDLGTVTGYEPNGSDAAKEKCAHFIGTDNEGYPMLINFDSPFQIEINFGDSVEMGKSIAGFQFQAPSGFHSVYDKDGNMLYQLERLPRFMGIFAVYATNNPNATTQNIKNDSNWTKVVELQNIRDIEEDKWTDWYTTNIYNPNRDSGASDDWDKFTRYVIEIYSQMDAEVNIAQEYVFIKRIRAVYSEYYKSSVITEDGYTTLNTETVPSHKVSTINYGNNNTIQLYLPGFPQDMEYYKYNVTLDNITYQNGYRTGDLLYYTYNAGGASRTYYFNVRITNIDNGAFEVFLTNATIGEKANKFMAGKDKISITEAALLRHTGPGHAEPGMPTATITIESESSILVYGSTVGDAYSKEETERKDQPIINKYNHFTTYIEFKQPKVKNAIVELTVDYDDLHSFTETKQKVIEAVHDVFKMTPYYIGKSLDVSDIWQAVNKVEGVKRFIVNAPTENVYCEPFEFILLPENNLIIHDILNSTIK